MNYILDRKEEKEVIFIRHKIKLKRGRGVALENNDLPMAKLLKECLEDSDEVKSK